MSSKFSATLKIGDLNDYIAPSQGCIVSLKSGSDRLLLDKPSKAVLVLETCKIIRISTDVITFVQQQQQPYPILSERAGNLFEIYNSLILMKGARAYLYLIHVVSLVEQKATKTASPPETFQKDPVKISLKDCLACSGCITSAETVMLEKQSLDEFLANINNGKTVVVSLSPQSRASIAVHYGLSPVQVGYAMLKKHLAHMFCHIFPQPGDIYHVTVMPCYDKKLEASRDDFVFQDQSDGDDQMTTEVDSVLTTGEVVDLIQSKAVDFSNLDEAPLDKLLSNVSEEGHLFGVRGSSGGYTDTVFRYAAKTLFDQDIKGPLEFRTLRNSDFKEVTLEVEGKTVLKFALCYGFRNLQNVVRKIKDGKSDYHFLEIMACPSGCLNGGGQLKPKPGQSGKDLVQALETTYMENVLVADPFENPIVKSLYSEWLGHPGSEKAKTYIHTQYHRIEKSVTSQLNNW
ncbi:NAR1-like protein [Tanacetum coccineum]